METKQTPILSDEDRAKLADQISKDILEAKKRGEDPNLDSMIKEKIDLEYKAASQRFNEAAAERAASERTAGMFDLEESYQKAIQEGENNLENPFSFKGKMVSTERELKVYNSDKDVDLIRQAQELNDQLYILGTVLADKHKCTYAQAIVQSKFFARVRERYQKDADLQKALNTGTTAQGLELIPTGMSGRIIERINLRLGIASLFEQVPMPTNPYKLPVDTGDASAYLITEVTTDTPTLASNAIKATTPATGNFSFDAVGIGNRVRMSYDITEDAILNLTDYISRKIVEGQDIGVENAIINGDTTATHMDSDTTAATDPRKAWKGLRYYGINANAGGVDFGNADPSLSLLGSIMLEAGQYSAFPQQCVWIPSPKTYTKMRIADIGVQTVKDYGPQAVVLTGELGQWNGAPIIPSNYQRENLNASGVYDGATTDRGAILYVFRPGFMMGVRRGVLLESARDIENQQSIIVASRRLHFKSPWDPTSASYPFSTIGYNVKTV